MTRFLSLILAATLIAGPTLAGGINFDMPNLTFPDAPAPVTQSTSGTPVKTPN